MRARRVTFTALSTLGAAAGVAPLQAHAASSTTIVVDNGNAACADSATSGSVAQPFCTIQSASTYALPGETVLVQPGTGHYVGAQDITTSGTPGNPITYQAAAGTFLVDGPQFGFSVDWGVHDVTIQGFHIATASQPGGYSALGVWIAPQTSGIKILGNTITGATATSTTPASGGITVGCGDNILIQGNTVTGGPGIQLCGADSGVNATPQPTVVDHNVVTGVQPDPTATTQVGAIAVNSAGLTTGAAGTTAPTTIVSDNTIANNGVAGLTLGGGTVPPTGGTLAAAGNFVHGNAGGGIVATGFTQEITGNTVVGNNGAGISVLPAAPGGAAQSAQIQDNIVATTGAGVSTPAFAAPVPAVGIAVDPASFSGTTMDYNLVYAAGSPYAQGTTLYQSLGALQSATGQGLHDLSGAPLLNTDGTLKAGSPAIDSANAGAPALAATDLNGQARHNDPGVCDTGTGSPAYADRGAFEFQGTTSPAVACPAPTTPPSASPLATPTVDSVDFPAQAGYFGTGRPGTLHVHETSAGGTSVQYAFDATGPLGSGTKSAAMSGGDATIPYTAQTAGAHWLDVQVTDGSGHVSLATRYAFTVAAVDTATAPTAAFTGTPDPTNPLSISVDAIKSLHGSRPIAAYTVDFGDGTVVGPQAAAQASHVYAKSGVYPITVTVTDTDGLTSALSGSYDTTLGQPVQPTPAPPVTSTLYVNNVPSAAMLCTDSGATAGSASTPFCTISAAAAAVQPGQTILVQAGSYTEDVTLTQSGTSANPVILQAAPGVGLAPRAMNQVFDNYALTVQGAHDVVVRGFTIDTHGLGGIDVTGSQNVDLENNKISDDAAASLGAFSAVAFTGVSNSTVTGNAFTVGTVSGVTVDKTSLRATVTHNTVTAPKSLAGTHAMSIAASDSTIVDNVVSALPGGVDVALGADRTVVADNLVTCATTGIAVEASGVAVTSNTTVDQGTGIAVSGPVTGVTVENNVATGPGPAITCPAPGAGGAVGLSVDAQASAGTTADYNDVDSVPYKWGAGSYATSAAFHQATGEGAHDSSAATKLDANAQPQAGSSVIDSANSAAPGMQSTDLAGAARHDDPGIANTGVGPIAYADRGAYEFQGTSPTPPPPPPPPPSTAPTVSRIAGGDRYATSVMVSQAQWQAGAAQAVVLAKGMNYPDALAGVPLAAHVHGPLLLTDTAALDGATIAEIQRVLGVGQHGKTVYILGGTSAVSPAVAQTVANLGYQVVRYGGADRYGTALAIAKSFGPTDHVLVATGMNFADALAAGPLGAVENSPIVLSQDGTLDPDTAAFIQGRGAIEAIGGQAKLAVQHGINAAGKTVRNFAGDDRYQTGALVAGAVTTALGHAPTGVGVASGLNFPDALTGGAFAANAGEPLLLTDPSGLPGSVATVLQGMAVQVKTVILFGGTGAVSNSVEVAIANAVGGKIV